MNRTIPLVFLGLLALGACSEAATGAGDDGGGLAAAGAGGSTGDDSSRDDDSSRGNDAAGASSTGDDAGGAPSTGTPDVCGFTQDDGLGVVINEISAKGDDWIELYNGGSTGRDLSGFVVVDRDKDTGCPKLDGALAFPDGTTIPSGGYLLVLAGQKDPTAGAQTDCLKDGPKPCYDEPYGISSGDGDGLALVKGTIEYAHAEVPPGTIDDDQKTWARLPNGTGDFAVAKPTPGGANEAN